ncbi:hypothetical protein ABZT49_08710 [Methylobacterium sp. EM32]
MVRERLAAYFSVLQRMRSVYDGRDAIQRSGAVPLIKSRPRPTKSFTIPRCENLCTDLLSKFAF